MNALAERELAEAEARLKAQEAEVSEATAALLRLEAEAKAVERAYGERLKEAFARFQEAFRQQALALLGAQAEARREGSGLRLVLVPAGKRTQDLRLLSLGRKPWGPWPSSSPWGNSKVVFPWRCWTRWMPPWTRPTCSASPASWPRDGSSSWSPTKSAPWKPATPSTG